MIDLTKRYISILRGINVGGKRKIIMSDLKILYEELGFSNVITYIQSGNVIFDMEKKTDEKTVSLNIQNSVFNKYGFRIPVIIRTYREMNKIISANPFLKDRNADINKLHLTFLSELPAETNTALLKSTDYSPDRYSLNGREVYIQCSGRYSDCRLTNNVLESRLKVTATTRNWKTIVKILELSNEN